VSWKRRANRPHKHAASCPRTVRTRKQPGSLPKTSCTMHQLWQRPLRRHPNWLYCILNTLPVFKRLWQVVTWQDNTPVGTTFLFKNSGLPESPRGTRKRPVWEAILLPVYRKGTKIAVCCFTHETRAFVFLPCKAAWHNSIYTFYWWERRLLRWC